MCLLNQTCFDTQSRETAERGLDKHDWFEQRAALLTYRKECLQSSGQSQISRIRHVNECIYCTSICNHPYELLRNGTIDVIEPVA